jgi:hypothetical protein
MNPISPKLDGLFREFHSESLGLLRIYLSAINGFVTAINHFYIGAVVFI